MLWLEILKTSFIVVALNFCQMVKDCCKYVSTNSILGIISSKVVKILSMRAFDLELKQVGVVIFPC